MSEGTKLNADECFCRSCGGIIKKEAEICVKCGVRQSGKIDANLDILQELKKYKEHKHALCLECGYEGRMGTEKILSPWIRLPLYIVALPLCLLVGCGTFVWWLGIPFSLFVFYCLCWEPLNKCYYICPNCKNRLK